jgi:uncharacterized BrkB/YihY/UPF0761 family membrane protein
MARDIVDRYRRATVSVLAGHVAFRAFLWLVPFALLISAILGFFSAAHVSTGGGIAHLGISKSLQSSVDDAATQASRSRVPALLLALWGTAFSANSLLTALHVTFALAWGLPVGRLERRASLFGKFIGGLFAAMIGISLAVAIARSNALVGVGSAVAMFGVYTAALLGLSWILPRRARNVWELLPGCLVGGLGLLALHLVNTLYVPTKVAHASQIYGGLGVALVSLGTLFLLSQLIIFSAILNASWFEFQEAGASWLPDLSRVAGRKRSDRETTDET